MNTRLRQRRDGKIGGGNGEPTAVSVWHASKQPGRANPMIENYRTDKLTPGIDHVGFRSHEAWVYVDFLQNYLLDTKRSNATRKTDHSAKSCTEPGQNMKITQLVSKFAHFSLLWEQEGSKLWEKYVFLPLPLKKYRNICHTSLKLYVAIEANFKQKRDIRLRKIHKNTS